MQPYQLKSGNLLIIGREGVLLYDVTTKQIENVDTATANHLDQLLFSGQASVSPAQETINFLLEKNYIENNTGTADSVVKHHLRTMDKAFDWSRQHLQNSNYNQAYDLLLDAHATRRRLCAFVGQCPILPETALRRAALVGEVEITGKKRVVCIGDDDLVSIAIASLGHEVVVYDIDDYLLFFIEQFAATHKLNITTTRVDLREPLPTESLEQFDVFLTDPMANRHCYELFLSRALALLKPTGIGFSAVFPPSSALFTDVCHSMKIEITFWDRHFNRYYSEKLEPHTYGSDWVTLKKQSSTETPVPPNTYCSLGDLYHENAMPIIPLFRLHIQNTSDSARQMPLYLHLIIDKLEQEGVIKICERTTTSTDDITHIFLKLENGFLQIFVDRPQQFMQIVTCPHSKVLQEQLILYFINAYKSDVRKIHARTHAQAGDFFCC